MLFTLGKNTALFWPKSVTHFSNFSTAYRMKKNFVIEVTEKLQAEEVEAFRLFLNSPYFNQGFNSQSLIDLFEILCQAIQGGVLATLEKQQIFESLFPDKPFVESRVDKLTTELKGLLQGFLITQSYLSPENEAQQLLDLTREIRVKNLEGRYFQSLEKLKKQSEAAVWESIDSHHFLHVTAIEEHEWSSTFNKSKGDLNVPAVIKHLDNYYFNIRTEMLNRLLLQHRQTILPESALDLLAENWIVPEEHFKNSPLLSLVWEVHFLLRQETPNVEGFHQLLKAIQQHEKRINPETLAQFYTYLRNICIILINAGQIEFLSVLHEIQKDNLARGYSYFQGKITPHLYLNITQVALNVHAIQWASDFVAQHQGKIIGENETQDFYRMNKAICLFAEKKYNEALETIPFGATYSVYHLMARLLELKIYYETKSELLEYKIDAFKMFISRAGQKVLSKSLHELFVNFINILRQLNLSQGIQNKSRSLLLIDRITKKKTIGERTWLLEKAKELGERKK